MSVAWTTPALGQLRAIGDYIARTSPTAGAVVTGRIAARTRALDGQPYLGAEVPDYGDPAVREVLEPP